MLFRSYHGILPAGPRPVGLSPGRTDLAAVVGAEATTTNEVVTPAEVVIETGDTEKLGVATIPSLFVAVRLTEPVNPLTGVMVKVTPAAVAPGCTVVVAPQVAGAKEKSGLPEVVEETISTEAIGPFG